MKKTMRNPTTCLFVFYFLLFHGMILCLQGCASSAASRGAAGEADKAYLQTDYAFRHMQDGGLSNAYQNTTQTTKGVIIGGALGAAAGSATSGVGTLAGLGVGALFGGAIGSYIDSHTTLADKLENRHIRVITLGDQILIIMPTTALFEERTSRFRSDAYETLDVVNQYISQFPNMSVKVAAYTSATESETVTQILSQQQADKITKYLWNRRINTRLLYAEGKGGSKLVTANVADWSSDNYRIEITLEKLPV